MIGTTLAQGSDWVTIGLLSTLYGVYAAGLPDAPFIAKQVELIDLLVEKFNVR